MEVLAQLIKRQEDELQSLKEKFQNEKNELEQKLQEEREIREQQKNDFEQKLAQSSVTQTPVSFQSSSNS